MARKHRVAAGSIAAPVCEAIVGSGVAGKVLGEGRSSFIGVGDFVIAITHDRWPLLPNGITVTAPLNSMLRLGDAVSVSTARIETPGVVVDLAGAAMWDPTVASSEGPRDAVRGRGMSILEACEISAQPVPAALGHAIENRLQPQGQVRLTGGFEVLLDALFRRDPVLASSAARRLGGRGPGLTPEGDDLLAAVAGAVVAFGPAVGFDVPERRVWLDALGGNRTRMTALSATLMGLALLGMVMEPAGRVMDLGYDEDGWRRGLARLSATGHGTGRAYALAIGATAALLGARTLVH